MTFLQVIDCKTSRFDDMDRLMDDWVTATEGKRTATHSIVGRDRSAGDHYVEIIEFPSYEEAMKNSNLPETNRIFEEMVALCDGLPSFTDLDVVRDEQLNKATARRFFEDVAVRGDLELVDELCTADYRDHDVAKAEETVVGCEALKEDVAGWRAAFDFAFSLHCQLAEGDQVSTHWSWRGTHQGDFMGLQPTGQEVTMDGVTIHRFRDGRIAEGWWIFDMLGLMRQLGAVPS
ncbi:ester cyclase [Streptomyces cinnamoneus]|uniref:Ester cyclase n=1 Tax=Streptomyces cinnamoneus TaxID=53446 RepID=A0A2G1XIN0_STRCJ|nr:ester cyclase [Streptomyces cinnamoneus]PHQ51087.1 ester cyclase [Streptomyces cinnamoneus]PPT13690.1 ester cyclase [Streptomyces cinnamoneus]